MDRHKFYQLVEQNALGSLQVFAAGDYLADGFKAIADLRSSLVLCFIDLVSLLLRLFCQ